MLTNETNFSVDVGRAPRMTALTPSLDHIRKIVQSGSIADVWAIHLEKMEEYGFDRLLYGFTNFRTHGDFGDISDMLVLSNHNEELIKVFVGQGLNNSANMVTRKGHQPGAYSWRAFLDRQRAGTLTEDEEKLADLNKKWGVNAGYTIWLNESNRRNRGVIGLAARTELTQDDVDDLWKDKGEEITLFNNIAHLRISQLPQTGRRDPLKPRQREVLQWVADGKAVKDIAQIMSLSQATVEKHLRTAREVLGVSTTGQAVRKASAMNQLFQVKN